MVKTQLKAPHLYVSGYGERIVLIHGSNIANPSFLWSAQFELAKQYQIAIWDRRGYGANLSEGEKGTYQQNVDDIIALLEDGAHLVGHSYGGLLSMVVAAQRPELIKSLLVIEPPAFGIAQHHPAVMPVITELKRIYASAETPEEFLTGFLRALGSTVAGPLNLSPLHRRAIIATMGEIAPWDIPLQLDKLASTAFPRLIVSGDWHPALMVTAETLAYQLNAQHVVIKGVGHDIQKTGQLFNEHLASLIQSAV